MVLRGIISHSRMQDNGVERNYLAFKNANNGVERNYLAFKNAR